MRTARFLKAFWTLTKPYWVSDQRGKGLTLLAMVIGLALTLVWVEVLFNTWNNDFYNSLQDRDQAEFFRQLAQFFLIAVLFIVAGVYRAYLQQMLMIEWRTWLTERFLADWMKDQAYYRMTLVDTGTDNPDQRIAEDLRLFVDHTLTLTLGLLSAVVTLVTFVAILWTLSGALEVAGITIPGYMVWVAIAYAGLGSWLTHVIGRPLIGLDFNRQRYEADFRFALVRLRENSEGVALYRGEEQERSGFRERFAAVVTNWWSLMRKQKQLGWFTSFYTQFAIIFPYVVVAPRYFSGAMQLGGIFQTASAFGQVQSALSWFINAYPLFATWKATVDRLVGFAGALDRVRALKLDGERLSEGTSVALEGVRIELPQGQPLLDEASLRFESGQPALITGPSGAGKSTLFRTLAGIWPYWNGRLRLPQGARLLFLPQKPYLPIGTLKQAAAYPLDTARFDDGEIVGALEAVGLGHKAAEFERHENWGLLLSGGEQQRLAFARALLHRPDWLFLDEATSSLPEAAQDELDQLLHERLPQTTVVSISHRAGLAGRHARHLLWRERLLAPAG